MPIGVVTFGQMAAHLPVLAVACNRCDRRGWLHTARLLAEHGPGLPMPDLRFIIAADCTRMITDHVHDVCRVHFPGLIGLGLGCLFVTDRKYIRRSAMPHPSVARAPLASAGRNGAVSRRLREHIR